MWGFLFGRIFVHRALGEALRRKCYTIERGLAVTALWQVTVFCV